MTHANEMSFDELVKAGKKDFGEFQKNPEPTNTKKSPFVKFKEWPIVVTVWKNEGKEGRFFYSATVTKVYKDSKGEYQNTHSLGEDEWLKAAELLRYANHKLSIEILSK